MPMPGFEEDEWRDIGGELRQSQGGIEGGLYCLVGILTVKYTPILVSGNQAVGQSSHT